MAADPPSISARLETAEDDRVHLLETFIAILGHDLTSPLTAVRMSAELLSYGGITGGPDGAPAKHVRRILLAAESMQRMIQDLLDLARTRGGGGFVLRRSASDLSELTKNVVEQVRLQHPARVIELASSGAVLGAWDAVRMTQALSNLVLNAVVHSPEETPVRVVTRDDPSGVTVEVHNHGAIAAEALPSLFQPFRRRSDSTGLGLGLYIAQQIVQAHGGRLVARSSEAEGTTLTATL